VSKVSTSAPPLSDERLYIDRFGHRHSADVLERWSPAVLKAMGILPRTEEDPPGA